MAACVTPTPLDTGAETGATVTVTVDGIRAAGKVSQTNSAPPPPPPPDPLALDAIVAPGPPLPPTPITNTDTVCAPVFLVQVPELVKVCDAEEGGVSDRRVSPSPSSGLKSNCRQLPE